MTDTPMITVSIAKLGNPIQEVSVAEGANVMDALRLAGYNLDAVLSVKRNGSLVAMDTSLSNGDVLLVSQDKIKGGSENVAEAQSEGNPIKLTFDVTTDNKPTGVAMLFYDNMSAFEIVKTVLHNKGVSMNYFKELREGGTKLGLDTKLVDGGNYTIVLEKLKMIEASDEDYGD